MAVQAPSAAMREEEGSGPVSLPPFAIGSSTSTVCAPACTVSAKGPASLSSTTTTPGGAASLLIASSFRPVSRERAPEGARRRDGLRRTIPGGRASSRRAERQWPARDDRRRRRPCRRTAAPRSFPTQNERCGGPEASGRCRRPARARRRGHAAGRLDAQRHQLDRCVEGEAVEALWAAAKAARRPPRRRPSRPRPRRPGRDSASGRC